MDEPAEYKVLESSTYKSNKKDLMKKYFKGKSQKGAEKIFNAFCKALESSPCPKGSLVVPKFREKCNTLPEECQLHKMQWDSFMRLKRGAQKVRCFYLVFGERKIAVPLLVYNHVQYPGQPPWKEIVRAAKLTIRKVNEDYPISQQ